METSFLEAFQIPNAPVEEKSRTVNRATKNWRLKWFVVIALPDEKKKESFDWQAIKG